MDNFVVITGCSGGGKSTLITELQRRGYTGVEEPGRRIVARERATGGKALPWIDLAAFAREAIKLALEDRTRLADEQGWTFIDRGVIDACSALMFAAGQDPLTETLMEETRYHQRVFAAAPWSEIYVQDEERRHGLADAIDEYERLSVLYPKLGYEWIVLPNISVEERADFVLQTLTGM